MKDNETMLMTNREHDDLYVDEATRLYNLCGFALLLFVTAASALRWSLYPVFVDTYYHMGVVEGFRQAGGIVTRAFWEMAPAGRVHIYPPALHAAGYLLSLLGVTPALFITLLSWAFYPTCLLTTWLWLKRIAGPKAALWALVLLCSPPPFFFNQAAHTANAAVLAVAPLALLALETERFLICAVLNFIVISLHPIGLFLPPALVINALFRRKRIVAGLLAAAVPVLLYAPWMAHVWANRSLLPPQRTGGTLSLGGHGANLGLIPLACAGLAIPGLLLRRDRTLALVGPLMGFAGVLPLGFGGRFLMFNVHWPLACVGGLGLGQLARQFNRSSSLRPLGHVVQIFVAVTALIAFPSIDLRLAPAGRGKTVPPGPPPEMRSAWQVHSPPAALPRLFDPQAPVGPGPGPGPAGPGGMDFIHQPGAESFFEAISRNTEPADVVFVPDPPVAALITGVTGRWTSNGMLSEVSLTERRPEPKDCDYIALVQPKRPPGPLLGRPIRPPRPDAPAGYERVFENEFGSLWRNPVKLEHSRQPARPAVGLVTLCIIWAAGLFLVILDLRPVRRSGPLRLAVPICAAVVAACLFPVVRTAALEFQNPPVRYPEPLAPRPLPPFVEEIRHKHEMVQNTVQSHLEQRISPDYFWRPQDQQRFDRLMQESRFEEANQLLDERLRLLDETLRSDTPAGDARPRLEEPPLP